MSKTLPKILTATFEYLEEYSENRFKKPKTSVKTGVFADYQNGTVEEPSGGACRGSTSTVGVGSILIFGAEGQLRLTIQKQLTPWQES